VVDPSARKVVGRVPVAGNPREVREGEGTVWVTMADAGTVNAIAVASREVAAKVKVEGSPFGLAVGEGRVWAASLDRGLLTPIEPRGKP
jgi:YVTN family beta-propeller protein